MKALIYTLPLLLSAAIFAGCSQNQYAQQEYDDMYYTSQDRQQAIAIQQAREEGRRQGQLEEQRRREAEAEERRRSLYDNTTPQSARQTNPDAVTYSDEQYYEEDAYYQEPRATGTAAQGQVINNHYYGTTGAGWGRPGWGSAWGPGWGSGFAFSFGMGMGWNSWNMWCDPFWDPWCMGGGMGYGFGYDPFFMRPAWAWNGWGYQNAYARGYRHGFYDARWNRMHWGSYYNPRTVIVYQGDRSPARNTTYGPRTSRAIASNDLGVGQRVATYDRMQNARQQRVENSIERGRTMDAQQPQRRVQPQTRPGERATPAGQPNRDVRTRETPRTTTPQQRTAPTRGTERTQPAQRSTPPAARPAPSRGTGGTPSQRGGGGGSTPRSGRGGGEPLSSTYNMDQQGQASPQITIDRAASPAAANAMQAGQRAVRTAPSVAQPERNVSQREIRSAATAPEGRSLDAPRRSVQAAQQAPASSRPAQESRRQTAAPAPTYRAPAQPASAAPSRSSYSSPQRSSQPSVSPSSSSPRSSSPSSSPGSRSGSSRSGGRN